MSADYTWKKEVFILCFSEHEIPDNISCIKLLIHWNSQLGEGKGQSHVALTHRLKQLGHENLADWLSRTVFHRLGQDLNRTLLMDPFKELAQTDKTEARYCFNIFITSQDPVWKYRICGDEQWLLCTKSSQSIKFHQWLWSWVSSLHLPPC
jgi:hypothetical protein